MKAMATGMFMVMGSSGGVERKEGGERVGSLTQLVDWLSLSCEEKGQRQDMLREGKAGVTWTRLSLSFGWEKSLDWGK